MVAGQRTTRWSDRQRGPCCLRVGPLLFPWAWLATDALHYYNNGLSVSLNAMENSIVKGHKITEL